MISKISQLIASLGALALAFCVFISPATAQQSDHEVYRAENGKQFGYLLEPGSAGLYSTFLGRFPDVKDSAGLPLWCVNVTHLDPTEEDITSLDTLTAPTRIAPTGLQVTTAQMAYLIEKYQHSEDPVELAGVAYLVHLNFEQETDPAAGRNKYPNTNTAENLAHLREAVLTYAEFIETKSRELVLEAIENTQVGYQPGDVLGQGERSGRVYSLGVTNEAGNYLSGHEITVTLDGPAIFSETGTNEWSGKTSTNPISLDWEATGNGQVSVKSKISATRNTLTLLHSKNTHQDTVSVGARPSIDLTEITTQGPTWLVRLDFQPIGASHVAKISDGGTFTDTFTASADKNYGNGKWLSLTEKEAKEFGLTAGNMPVKYRATAYFTGTIPAPESAKVPQDAKLFESVEVVANGPGEISASFSATEPGFVTVVWEVLKSDQGDLSKFIHSDWSDGFGRPEETVSLRHAIDIDTALSIRTTKSGVYLVDDVFVSGFPADHGNFSGDGRFSADVENLTQSLYFFPADVEVSDSNLEQAELIGKNIPIPAKNGFHPSIGATELKVKQNSDGTLIPGTYVFVTSFAGDDRVKPFTTSVNDRTEQYLVTNKPELHTTLTHEGAKSVPASGIQTLVDQVCYTNLQTGE